VRIDEDNKTSSKQKKIRTIVQKVLKCSYSSSKRDIFKTFTGESKIFLNKKPLLIISKRLQSKKLRMLQKICSFKPKMLYFTLHFDTFCIFLVRLGFALSSTLLSAQEKQPGEKKQTIKGIKHRKH